MTTRAIAAGKEVNLAREYKDRIEAFNVRYEEFSKSNPDVSREDFAQGCAEAQASHFVKTAPNEAAASRLESYTNSAKKGAENVPEGKTLATAAQYKEINEAKANKVVGALSDGKAVNDAAVLKEEFGIEAKGGFTNKNFTNEIAKRAEGGFDEKEIEQIRSMAQEKGADGQYTNVKGAESVTVQAPTINANAPEVQQAAR
jgi:hypothetical protein